MKLKIILLLFVILLIAAGWVWKTNILENSSDNQILIYEKEGMTLWGVNEKEEIKYKETDGFEEWFDYDENGKMIHGYDSDGYEFWMEYNEDGNMIYQKNNEGFEAWYNENGECIKAIY